MAERYAAPVTREIDSYADIVGTRPVTSLYIGGGTPTTVLHHGMPDMLDHIYEVFDSESMQMAGWLYWRIYEASFAKRDFRRRFGQDFDSVYGRYFRPLWLLGFLKDDGEQILLTDKGTYWLHCLEDLFSIEYVSRLWGTSKQQPWPERVVL